MNQIIQPNDKRERSFVKIHDTTKSYNLSTIMKLESMFGKNLTN